MSHFQHLIRTTWSAIKLGRATFSYSVVQLPFDILTSPGHCAILGNKRLGLPGETISHPDLCAANKRRAQTQPSQSINSHLGPVEPRRFISGTLRNSR